MVGNAGMLGAETRRTQSMKINTAWMGPGVTKGVAKRLSGLKRSYLKGQGT